MACINRALEIEGTLQPPAPALRALFTVHKGELLLMMQQADTAMHYLQKGLSLQKATYSQPNKHV